MLRKIFLIQIAFLVASSGASFPIVNQQAGDQAVEYCIREWTIYNDGPGDLTHDGPNRHQIVGARYDLRPDANKIGANLNKLREWGIFAYSVPQTGSDILLCVPANPNRVLTSAETFTLSTGIDDVPLTPRRFSDVIFDLATLHADNSDTDRAPSLRPTRAGSLNLYLGNRMLQSEKFVLGQHRASAKVLEAYQETYRKIREETLSGGNPPGTHQLYLGHLKAQFETNDTDQFIPDDLPKVPPIDPRSTISDDFDGGAPGVLTDDFNLDWSLTSSSVDCDVAVQSGDDDYAIELDSATCENFAVAGVSTDDHNVQATVRYIVAINNNEEHALFARKACGNTTRTWYAWWEEVNPTPEQRIRERTGGSSVTLASDGAPVAKSADTDYVYKLVVDGSDITGTVDGGEDLAASDASITGNLCAGIRCRSSATAANDCTMDDWSQTDEGAPPVRRIFIFWPF